MTSPNRNGDFVHREANLTLRFQEFLLPPIRHALVIGKHARVRPEALERAFERMSPGCFRLLQVTHPTIAAVLVARSMLRNVPEEDLVATLVRNAEGIMDADSCLEAEIEVEIVGEDTVDL
ncbi:MAG: hypothetical protein HYU36_15965 [Planctomycetes bacterium]|nr:hypothetical protein [Planctomycetota bacterium]